MEYDYEALELKKTELHRLFLEAHPTSIPASRDAADSAFEAFVGLLPPTKPQMLTQMITMKSAGAGGGQSRKPGNIVLNWSKLMDIVPDVTMAAVGGATSPKWLLPFICLYVWNKLWCSSQEELSEVEATIIWALWRNRNNQRRISEDDGFDRTNELRIRVALPPLSRKEYDSAVNRLLRIECIEISEGTIWLREWIRIQY